MKYFFTTIYFALLLSFLDSCRKDVVTTEKGFNYEQAAGIWVPYEFTDELGTTHIGSLTAISLFGPYCETVQLNSDKTFIPGNWENQSLSPRISESGTFEYLLSNKLRFKESWEAEWVIDKFEGDELWLKRSTQAGVVLYKFKRQL